MLSAIAEIADSSTNRNNVCRVMSDDNMLLIRCDGGSKQYEGEYKRSNGQSTHTHTQTK